jgi:hypothetical protein
MARASSPGRCGTRPRGLCPHRLAAVVFGLGGGLRVIASTHGSTVGLKGLGPIACSLGHSTSVAQASSPGRCVTQPRWLWHHRLAALVLGLGGGPHVIVCPRQLCRPQGPWPHRLPAGAPSLGGSRILAWPPWHPTSVPRASPPGRAGTQPPRRHHRLLPVVLGLGGLTITACPLWYLASGAQASSPTR